MLRRIFLVVIGAVSSFALSACAGYFLYSISAAWTEGRLALMVRFIFNPIIAAMVGVLVGLLSKDHAELTSIIALVPWSLILHGVRSTGTLKGNLLWMGAVSICFLCAATSATLASRVRHGRDSAASGNVART
jgi:hypothetical protein